MLNHLYFPSTVILRFYATPKNFSKNASGSSMTVCFFSARLPSPKQDTDGRILSTLEMIVLTAPCKAKRLIFGHSGKNVQIWLHPNLSAERTQIVERMFCGVKGFARQAVYLS
jgi:hypothetical protein